MKLINLDLTEWAEFFMNHHQSSEGITALSTDMCHQLGFYFPGSLLVLSRRQESEKLH